MGLGTLEQLVTLYLEENLLEGLEDFSLRNLSSLEELYINHNHLNSISQHAFSGLTSLLRYPIWFTITLRWPLECVAHSLQHISSICQAPSELQPPGGHRPTLV